MSLKQRIEALEDQLFAQGTCTTCGGRHTRSWTDLLQTIVADIPVCSCLPCCGWLAGLHEQEDYVEDNQ